MTLKGADILTAAQFSREQIETLFTRADELAARLENGERLHLLDGKLLATVFSAPSLRTRASFQAAMQRLDGGVISIDDAQTTAATRGESFADVIQSITQYVDVIVLRHPEIGAARRAAEIANVPVFNAGDGTGENPTQALVDLYTLLKEKPSLDGLRVAVAGDLKNDAAAHSLARALSLFQIEYSFVAPAALAMPLDITDGLRERGLLVEETNDLARCLRRADVIYMTRVQKEWVDAKQYEKLKSFSMLNRAMVEQTKPGLVVLHPLPRADEIAGDVDALPTAAYFRQARNALVIRMALLAQVLQA